MSQKKVHTLTDVLSQGALQSLRQRAAEYGSLNTLLGLYLDNRMRHQVRVVAYTAGTLTLAANNTTVAGQLRYLSHIYMQQLRVHNEFCDLKRISVTVDTENRDETRITKTHQQPPKRTISPQTAKLLEETADSLGEGELSEALRRLASHVSDS